MNRHSPEPATVLRGDVESGYRLIRDQDGAQLQLCVPPDLKGDSYRLKDRDLGRVPTATTNDE